MEQLERTQTDSKAGIGGLDVLKFFLACLIPLLHIDFGDIAALEWVRQYLARPGVPVFFAVTGFLLAREIERSKDLKKSFLKFATRTGWLLTLWLIIDLPIYVLTRYEQGASVLKQVGGWMQEILFLTPGYLWYLTAAIVGLLLVWLCMKYIRSSAAIFCTLFVIYVIGVCGNSWGGGVLSIGFPQGYFDLFLTTRNGVFFSPVFIYIGIMAYKRELSPRNNVLLLIGALCLYFCEVYYIRSAVASGTDTSMYFSLPLLVFCIVMLFAKNCKLQLSQKLSLWMRKLSTLIYCTQYICLTLVSWVGARFGWYGYIRLIVAYASIFACSLAAYWIISKANCKLLKKLY